MTDNKYNKKTEEIRSLDVSLDKAVKWYLGDNKELRDIALELYTEDMLREPLLKSIKTFDDALNLYVRDRNTDKDCKVDYDMASVEKKEILYTIDKISRWSLSTAMKFKIDIVLNVLNQFADTSQKCDNLYYPCFYIIKQNITDYNWEDMVHTYPYFNTIKNILYHSLNIRVADKINYQIMFRVCKKHYNVMGIEGDNELFSVFDMRGIIACATNLIALHLGKYFSQMIFEAYSPYSSENDNIRYYDIPDEEKKMTGINVIPTSFMASKHY